MKNFTSFAPLDFLCNKWRGSNLRPLTNPNKYLQYAGFENIKHSSIASDFTSVTPVNQAV